MPLQNRVDPFGELHAVAARGLFMGNRGGRFHDADRRPGARRQVSRRWICCLCEFRGRKREVWADGYTELFFLDEPTALAAGHRPCFECRRADALAFMEAFGARSADEMDRVLDAERRHGRTKRLHKMSVETLPDGALFERDGMAYGARDARLLQWSFTGYREAVAQLRDAQVNVLTPPSICRALTRGYAPHWHPSAAR